MATPPLALHTWSLDSTPLAEVLQIARQTGWQAVELRHVDFTRAAEAGQREEEVIDLVRASGLAVAAIGARLGWMYAEGEERRELLEIFEAACRRAAALGCPVVQCPVDFGTGELRQAAGRVREVGDMAGALGLRVALEPYVVAQQFKTLASGRELLAAADHPSVGLDVDSYHIERSGDGIRAMHDLALAEIVHVQYSDVPVGAGPATPEDLLNRLPPGQGSVPFAAFRQVLDQKGYTGYYSYEAPNPAAWDRDPLAVAQEAHAASLVAFL
ncbi:MAG: sugar phosphate isomerase/epimerase family protein [Chloroflexota bacterium]